MKDPFKKFMQDEMDREAEQIEREVLQNKELEHIEVPPEMYDNVLKTAEKEKAKRQDTEERYQNLSKEEREWLALGRELAGKKTKGSVVVKRRGKARYKVLVLAATMTIMLFAAGLTTLGGPQHLMERMKWIVGGREQVTLVPENEKVISPEGDKEEQAYQDIKDELGFDAVRMLYLPEGTSFDKAIFQKEANSVALVYKCVDNHITYSINTSYQSKSYSYDVEDTLIEEYSIDLNEIKVSIKKYTMERFKTNKFSAQFEYNNVNYFLSAVVSQEEFEKIIKDLKFF